MAAVKITNTIYDSVALDAGSGLVNSNSVNLTASYGASLYVKLTNGGTAPSTIATCQPQVSPNNSDWFNFGDNISGQTGINEVTSKHVEVPAAVKYLRIRSGGNEGQNVTIDSFVDEITAV